MSDDWKAGLKRAVIDAIVSKGLRVRDDPSLYGWGMYEYDEKYDVTNATGHRILTANLIDYEKSTWDESSWHQFNGTFNDEDDTRRGVDASIVCVDGTVYPWRWECRLGEMILAVMRDE